MAMPVRQSRTIQSNPFSTWKLLLGCCQFVCNTIQVNSASDCRCSHAADCQKGTLAHCRYFYQEKLFPNKNAGEERLAKLCPELVVSGMIYCVLMLQAGIVVAVTKF